MDKQLLYNWLKSVTTMADIGNLDDIYIYLCFDRNKLEGFLFKDEVIGFSSLGYTDNIGYLVKLSDLLFVMEFLDVLDSRKNIYCNTQSIEFSRKGTKIKIQYFCKKEIELPVWETGKRIDISEDLSSLLSRSNGCCYFIDGNMVFVREGIIVKKKLANMNNFYFKFPASFISLLTLLNSNFSSFIIGPSTLFLSNKDLEITFYYQREGLDTCENSLIRKEYNFIDRKALKLGDDFHALYG